MFLTLEGRLFHNTGAAVWNYLSPRDFLVFATGNFNNSSSEERSWYSHLHDYL